MMEKGYEKEYKWRADDAILNHALLWASAHIETQNQTFYMKSQYFDTSDGFLHKQNIALRLRQENQTSICCMKRGNQNTPEGMRSHEEYQCEANSIQEGLAILPEHGAPTELCAEVSAMPLKVTCEVTFTRSALLLQEDNTVCELALDSGTLYHNGKSMPLCEIELEFIAGDEKIFHTLAASLASYLSLTPEPLSKLERALAL